MVTRGLPDSNTLLHTYSYSDVWTLSIQVYWTLNSKQIFSLNLSIQVYRTLNSRQFSRLSLSIQIYWALNSRKMLGLRLSVPSLLDSEL